MAFNTSTIVFIFKKHPLGFSAFGLALLLFIGTSVRSGSKEDFLLQVEEVTAKGQKLKNNLKYAAELDQQLTAISGASIEVTDRAIITAALATNLQYFYRIESDLGIEYTDLRQGVPPAPVGGASFLSVPYNVSVQGTYTQLLEFIRRLETGVHFVRFKSTSLSPGRNVGESTPDPTNPVLALAISIDILGKQ
jgi:hypothetical protein